LDDFFKLKQNVRVNEPNVAIVVTIDYWYHRNDDKFNTFRLVDETPLGLPKPSFPMALVQAIGIFDQSRLDMDFITDASFLGIFSSKFCKYSFHSFLFQSVLYNDSNFPSCPYHL
jgi:hypothetical protein